ncbi:heavy-metal-associated domain-containing protein [Thermotoga profunda]|uniref:heavy-metal-associated domain-containing protein n=1 Tax=Thermotoga profunda TaxID=1508420 RepID=UPI000597074E|nr:heavy-metal-associated domain-containing protein [Thermotoga profunda]
MRYLLHVPDISCNHCKMRISKRLEEIGVKDYQIDVVNKTVVVGTENIEKIIDELAKIDYPVERYEKL